MNQHIDNSRWIGAYLEWTETEPGTPRQDPASRSPFFVIEADEFRTDLGDS